jgi:CPA2 family monovalent cation:H+ antiporter-2
VLLTIALIVLVKGALSAAITSLFGYPVRTALLTGVTLAQSAEFSFLMARVGTEVGAVSPAVFNLMLIGAAASIMLAPGLYHGAQPLSRWLERRLAFGARAVPLAATASLLRGHAVLCGYGRVGQVIGAVLRQRQFPFVVIDEEPRRIRQLQKQGIPALLGDAANQVLLERVNLAQARVLIVAIPDPLATRQIVEYARRVNPDLDIVARTHSATEAAFLLRRGVSEVVHGELELALEMSRHTLRRFGVSALETLAIIQRLREQIEQQPDNPALG